MIFVKILLWIFSDSKSEYDNAYAKLKYIWWKLGKIKLFVRQLLSLFFPSINDDNAHVRVANLRTLSFSSFFITFPSLFLLL